jgi:hypothetical protein
MKPQMIDQQLARLRTHRNNIQRYRNLLQTNLTELERQFVEKRLIEEQSNLDSLITSLPQLLHGRIGRQNHPRRNAIVGRADRVLWRLQVRTFRRDGARQEK